MGRNRIVGTTVLAVRRGENVVMAGDGQVTLDNAKVKGKARKVRRLASGSVLAGFAGGAADAFALLTRFEDKLAEYQGQLERAAVELVREWRTDRMLRRFEAMLVVADAKRTFLLSGTGDLIESDDGVLGIGSGSVGAVAAARALIAFTQLEPRVVATESLRIAAGIDIYTNDQLTVEEISNVVFYMPDRVEPPGQTALKHGADKLTPRQIVQELDRFIVGQARAKRAVAIALRNRVRRQMLDPQMAEEVLPKNILMIGPTGVGKTEIARRLARLAGSPFLKVEASKFTEVGYVGRDVESMIRDLVEVGIEMLRQERRMQVRVPAAKAVHKRLLDQLLPPRPAKTRSHDAEAQLREKEEQASWERSRETLSRRLEAGELEDRMVELETSSVPSAGMRIFTPGGMEELDMNLRELLPNLFQGKRQRRRMSVREAREVLQREEEERLIDPDRLSRDAIRRVEESGILFIDELDKIAGRETGHGPEISREGVQRDLLPIVEGTFVNTKYGIVRTEHVLFVAAGAFHVAKPSDLIPEMQGRFPIRVELDALGQDELVRILTEPEASLVRQYEALLGTEGVELVFAEDGIVAIAEAASHVNERTENIGARRLTTILERLLDEVSFEGSEMAGQRVVIDASYVHERLDDIAKDTDLSRYIL